MSFRPEMEVLEDRLALDGAPLGAFPPLNLPVSEYTTFTFTNGRQAWVIQGGGLTRALTDDEVSLIQQWNSYDAAIGGAPYIYLGFPNNVDYPPLTIPLTFPKP